MADSVTTARHDFAAWLKTTLTLTAPGLADAFATVPREAFLGPPPWRIGEVLEEAPGRWRTAYRDEADPAGLYVDTVVAIDPARQLNNGQPSCLARLLEGLRPAAGETVVHLGCGAGYYTALIAHMVGPDGQVYAIDADPMLADRARRNLRDFSHVVVTTGQGDALPPADAILVNAGATAPRQAWLEAMRPGGRLVLPLTDESGGGVAFLIERGEAEFTARPLMRIAIYPCTGARRAVEAAAISSALAADPAAVRRLRLDPHPSGTACWLHGESWCLSR